MKLEEQFKENYRKYGGLEMNFNPIIGLEEIAENFAIGFLDWCRAVQKIEVEEKSSKEVLETYKETL